MPKPQPSQEEIQALCEALLDLDHNRQGTGFEASDVVVRLEQDHSITAWDSYYIARLLNSMEQIGATPNTKPKRYFVVKKEKGGGPVSGVDSTSRSGGGAGGGAIGPQLDEALTGLKQSREDQPEPSEPSRKEEKPMAEITQEQREELETLEGLRAVWQKNRPKDFQESISPDALRGCLGELSNSREQLTRTENAIHEATQEVRRAEVEPEQAKVRERDAEIVELKKVNTYLWVGLAATAVVVITLL